MKDGLDVEPALEAWFAAARSTDLAEASARLQEGLTSLEAAAPLARADWGENPEGGRLTSLGEVNLPDHDDVVCEAVEFRVDGLRQFGVVLRPRAAGRYPLILYVHGAAFGVPVYALGWLAEIAREGYVVAGPAFRGEPLFAGGTLATGGGFKGEGEIENLLGEPRDVLGMADAAGKEPYTAAGKFAILGHSFGAGAGLLAAARSDRVAVVISYDAWLVNPFRFYWERLRGGSSMYWDSWEAYCEQPVKAQLRGLMDRSIVHHADRVTAPVLLFIGEMDGPAYHDCHDDLAAALRRHGKTVKHVTVKGGGHNFVLYYNSEPARYAYRIQQEWLHRYLPPAKPEAAEATVAPTENHE